MLPARRRLSRLALGTEGRSSVRRLFRLAASVSCTPSNARKGRKRGVRPTSGQTVPFVRGRRSPDSRR